MNGCTNTTNGRRSLGGVTCFHGGGGVINCAARARRLQYPQNAKSHKNDAGSVTSKRTHETLSSSIRAQVSNKAESSRSLAWVDSWLALFSFFTGETTGHGQRSRLVGRAVLIIFAPGE